MSNKNNLPKFIITMTIIILIGTLLGSVFYLLNKTQAPDLPAGQPYQNQIKAIELSEDKKSVLNAETKEVIFTIDETNKYLKDQGKEKYGGDCFHDIALSNKGGIIENTTNITDGRIIFSTGCLSSDLQEAWVGIYYFGVRELALDCALAGKSYMTDEQRQQLNKKSYFQFLITGSGKNFTWSEDDKIITYETELESGMTEIKTIDSVIGEIIELKSDISVWKTYRNEEFGYEIKYPKEWAGVETSQITNYASFTKEKRDAALSGFWISVYKNNNKISTRDWWDKEYKKGNVQYVFKGTAQTSGIDMDTYKEKEGLEFTHYVFSKDLNIYHIFTSVNDQLFKKYLDTFKSIDANQINTSDWKIYKNEKYGFEFKYPDDIEIDPKRYGYIILDVFMKKEEASGEKNDEYFDLVVSGDMIREQEYQSYDRLLVNSNGVKIYQSSATDDIGFHNYIISGKVKIDFRTEESLYNDGIFNTILSTFKITKNTDGLIWETYKNKKYEFEFKYPNFYTPYRSNFDSDLSVLTYAGPDSNNVAIAEIESHLFCCEAVTLKMFIVNENISPEIWFEKNYDKYFHNDFVGANGELKSFIISKRKIKYHKKAALEIIGNGDKESTYKLIIIEDNDYLVVINQNMKSEFLDSVLETFEFIDDVETINFERYANKDVGISFDYPLWIAKINDWETGGETGKRFFGSSPIMHFTFSGITSDYSQPRSGSFLDSQGYLELNGKYYYKYVGDNKTLIEPLKIIYSKSGEKILIVNDYSFVEFRNNNGPSLSPGKESLGAIINLDNDEYSGLVFLIKLLDDKENSNEQCNNNDFCTTGKIKQNDFENILKTIELNNS